MSMSSEPHILIVEDDREIRNLVVRLLRNNGYRATGVGDGREMDRALAEGRIDLVVLDVMLPGEDGLSICRRLRAASSVPIVIVSAKGEDLDRILGLEMGADDYVSKPFNPREVLARVKAVLRRQGRVGPESPEDVRPLRFDGWTLDPRRRILLDPGGTRVSVTEAEFELLKVFCQKPGRPLGRDQLLDLTQGRSAGPNERSIDILVARLRRKLSLGGLDPDAIRTIRTAGYVFTPIVEVG